MRPYFPGWDIAHREALTCVCSTLMWDFFKRTDAAIEAKRANRDWPDMPLNPGCLISELENLETHYAGQQYPEAIQPSVEAFRLLFQNGKPIHAKNARKARKIAKEIFVWACNQLALLDRAGGIDQDGSVEALANYWIRLKASGHVESLPTNSGSVSRSDRVRERALPDGVVTTPSIILPVIHDKSESEAKQQGGARNKKLSAISPEQADVKLAEHSSECVNWIMNDTQLGIWKALEGRVLRVEQLAKEVTGGETNRLYRDGLKTILEAKGLIKRDPKLGWYRPDSPPSDRVAICPKSDVKK